MWIFDPKKPANPHRNLIIFDYQCVTNDPVAPSRMRIQSTRNRGDAYPSRMRIHLLLARQTTGRASTSNSGNAYKSSAGHNQSVTPKTPTSA